ncbi:hypothetical protein H4S02_007705, partial [Coemansia sp. RSA 2611]
MSQDTPLLSQTERSVLLGQSVAGADDASLAALLVQGSYEEVLRSGTAKAVFGTDIDDGAAVDGLDAPSPFGPEFAAADIRPLVAALVRQHVKEAGPAAWTSITLVGACCLHAFVETNWTGPDLRVDPASLLPKPLAARWQESFITVAPLELPEGADKHEIGRREQMGRVYLGAEQSEQRARLDRELVKLMEADGEEAYGLTPRPLYLYLARLLLVDIPSECLAERDAEAPSGHWWAARMLLIQQSLLDYPAQSLLDQIVEHLDQVRKYLPRSPASDALKSVRSADEQTQVVPTDDMDDKPVTDDMVVDDEPIESKELAAETITQVPESETAGSSLWDTVSVMDRELWARYLLELGVVYSQHSMPLDAKRHIVQAQAASGLQWQMSGAKGKRTRFQTFDITQLVLLARSAQRVDSEHNAVPEAMDLNDDMLLENIEFTESSPELARQDLQIMDKCILLAFCLNVQNENPAHGLTTEQMMPFVTRVLQQPSNWSVYTMALLLRSRLEAHKTRTVERATLQLQQLVDQITRQLPESDEAGAAERLQYVFGLSLPSQWAMECELAHMFMSLGVIRSALDIFERLHMWDDVISCYTLLGQTEVAERIVRRELDANPDRPKLWCVLGDLKRDPELWRRAWEVSGQRFARAMRSLGAYHFKNGEYAEAVECYEKAVQLNPMYENSWYVLGCAAMKTEQWPTAAKAFLRVVSIDENNGESWNNLATVYLRMGAECQARAYHALREAIKYMQGSWQVWSNYMQVAMSLGLVSTAIHALGRVIDLRVAKVGPESVDLDALRAIVGMVARGAAFKGMDEGEAQRKEQRLTEQLDQLFTKKIEA